MKTKITLLLALVLITFLAQAQSPQKFNYQAVVRSNSGVAILNKQIGVKILIHETTAAGTVIYEETHTPTTNAYGVFSIQVGTGVPVSGTFNAIAWDTDKHYIETSIDVNGGTSYKSVGANELVSVPYALHAQTVENDKVDDADADTTNEIQLIIKVGNEVTLSRNGGSFTDEVYDGDSSQTNEIQTLSISGTNLALSNGGGTVSLNDADADATNEIQIVGKSGSTVVLSKGGGSFSIDDADASATNEIQTISKSGSTVTLSNSGGSFTDAVNDADASATNELQKISKSGTTVTLSNSGGSFTDAVNDADASATNELQKVTKSGNQVTLSNNGGSFTVADADSSKTNEIQTLSISGTNLALSNGGGNVAISGLNYWTKSGNNLYNTSNNIGIGTSSPKNVLHVRASKLDTSLAVFYNTNTSNGSHGVKGFVGSTSYPTGGYLGVTSKIGFDNNSEIKFPGGNGMEIGVLGVTTGGSGGDNIALMGHTNGGRAGYFKNSGAKTQVSIGVTNYGVYIDTGRLYVQDDAILNAALSVKEDAIIDGSLQVKTNVFVDGNLGVSRYIVHQSDNDTYLDFQPDRLRSVVGNYAMIDIIENGTSSFISMAPNNVNSGFGGTYTDAKLRVNSTTTDDNQYGSFSENIRNKNGLTIGSLSSATNSGAYNQSSYGAYNSSTNGCNGIGVRWSYGSWNTATQTSSTGTSASYGVVGQISTSDRSNVRYAGYFLGNVYSSGAYSASDKNLKKNISDNVTSLNKILALPVKTYQYKTKEFMQMSLPEGKQTGIMAQDLEIQFPELVSRTIQPAMDSLEINRLNDLGIAIPESAKKEVDFKAVNYTGLVPHLTSAVQEQQKIIEIQNTKIKTQEVVNAEQQKELNALKLQLENQRKLLLEIQSFLTK